MSHLMTIRTPDINSTKPVRLSKNSSTSDNRDSELTSNRREAVEWARCWVTESMPSIQPKSAFSYF